MVGIHILFFVCKKTKSADLRYRGVLPAIEMYDLPLCLGRIKCCTAAVRPSVRLSVSWRASDRPILEIGKPY